MKPPRDRTSEGADAGVVYDYLCTRGPTEQHELAVALGWEQHRTDRAINEANRRGLVAFDATQMRHAAVKKDG